MRAADIKGIRVRIDGSALAPSRVWFRARPYEDDPARLVPLKFTAIATYIEPFKGLAGDGLMWIERQFEYEVDADDDGVVITRAAVTGKFEPPTAPELRRLALASAAVPSERLTATPPHGLISREEYYRVLSTMNEPVVVSPTRRRARRLSDHELSWFARRASQAEGTDYERAQALGLARATFYRYRREAQRRGLWSDSSYRRSNEPQRGLSPSS